MAGSDKKEKASKANTARAGEVAPGDIPEPDVSGLIEAGLPEGLIRTEKLAADLIITFLEGVENEPPTGEMDYYRLQWSRVITSEEWDKFDEKTFTGGTTWVPLTFTIPSVFLLATENEGTFYLRYEHQNFNFALAWSEPVTIHIDKVPPNGAFAPEKMEFSITSPITDATFATDAFLEATIPPWSGEDIADVDVFFGWFKGELPPNPDPGTLIRHEDIAPDGKVQIPKDLIYAAGDGLCCGGYVLVDKAGNASYPSKYELMSVALGPLPTILQEPTVIDPTGGTDLLRSDIIDGHVIVSVPHVPNGKSTDIIVVKWKDHDVTPGLPVGSNPTSGFNIPVAWPILWEQYTDTAVGPVQTPVSYTVLRGVEPFDSPATAVECDFSSAGPINPDPDPANPLLEPVRVVGESGTENKLEASDENKDVFAKIVLVGPVVAGDSYQVIWNGSAISAAYVIKTEAAGDDIEILLNWDDIRLHGANTAMPVWYQLTNSAHKNPQEPKERTEVDIGFLVIEYQEAEALHLISPINRLTCASLRWDAGETTFGVEFKIPPSTYLQAGDEVVVTWTAYTDFNKPVKVDGAEKTQTFTNITSEQATNGIVWLVEPYDDHLLPTWLSSAQIGKGEVTYTITGKSGKSRPTNTPISLAQGGGACILPPAPNP